MQANSTTSGRGKRTAWIPLNSLTPSDTNTSRDVITPAVSNSAAGAGRGRGMTRNPFIPTSRPSDTNTSRNVNAPAVSDPPGGAERRTKKPQSLPFPLSKPFDANMSRNTVAPAVPGSPGGAELGRRTAQPRSLPFPLSGPSHSNTSWNAVTPSVSNSPGGAELGRRTTKPQSLPFPLSGPSDSNTSRNTITPSVSNSPGGAELGRRTMKPQSLPFPLSRPSDSNTSRNTITPSVSNSPGGAGLGRRKTRIITWIPSRLLGLSTNTSRNITTPAVPKPSVGAGQGAGQGRREIPTITWEDPTPESQDTDMSCLMCRVLPKNGNFDFCSLECRQGARLSAPLLLVIHRGHVTFMMVESKFRQAWKAATPCPNVKSVYRVVESAESIDSYYEYLHTYGNERFCYHGTNRNCQLGDDDHTALCTSSLCSACSIIRTSFKVSLANSGGAFGQGIYTSSASNKSASYSKSGIMFLAKVVLGKAHNVTAFAQVKSCPVGKQSVVFDRMNGKLNETVVYTNNAIRPVFMIMFG